MDRRPVRPGTAGFGNAGVNSEPDSDLSIQKVTFLFTGMRHY